TPQDRRMNGRHQRNRFGAHAVEFALIMPVLVAIVGGVIDYGWLFWREALAINALREGARAGSLKQPDLTTEAAGACAACESVAEAAAMNSLQAQNFAGYEVDAVLVRVPETG